MTITARVRKTIGYIAGYLDERTALHLSFLPARRSHVFPMTPVSLFALISVRATYLSCAERKILRLHEFRKPFSRLPRFPGDERPQPIAGAQCLLGVPFDLCVELKSAQGPLKS
jgi:hypothetical protein